MTSWLLNRLWRGRDRSQWLLRAVMAAVVALTTVALLTLATVPSVLDQQARTLGWAGVPEDPGAQALFGVDQDWVAVHEKYDFVGGERVTVVTVGLSGRGVPPPPGLAGFPEPGTAYLAPAVRALLADQGVPADYFGEPALGFEARALRGPGDLLVVRSVPADQVSPVAIPLTRLAPGQLVVPATSRLLLLVLGLAAAAVLVPPLLLMASILRVDLRTARRRLAALAVAGVGSRTLTSVVLIDLAVVAVLGWLLGLVSFWAGRPVLARLPTWEINPYSPSLVPPGWAVGLTALAPALVIAGSALTVRRVVASPLEERSSTDGAARRRTRLVSAGATFTVMVLFALSGASGLATSVLGAATLLLAAPSVVALVGRALALSARPAMVLAGGSLADTAIGAARTAAPTQIACYAAALFLVLNPAAVASAQAGVISQGKGSALVRVRAADPATTDRLTQQIQQVSGVHAATAVYVGDLPGGMAAPVNAWFGDCRSVVAASSLPDELCTASDTVMWATGAARSALAAGDREVMLPQPHDPAPMNAFPDEHQPVSVTVPDLPSGELDTPAASWDLPGLLVDPVRAGLDLSSFRPEAITVMLDDTALEEVSYLVSQAVPTATITTRETGLWGFAGQLERYYTQLLTGALVIFVLGAAGALATAWAQRVEQARTHAVLHAAGIQTRTLRASAALGAALPPAVLSVLAVLLAVTVGFGLLGGRTTYAAASLQGLLPLGGTLLAILALSAASAFLLGPRIGPEQLREE